MTIRISALILVALSSVQLLPAQEVLRGEIWIDLEPAYSSFVGQPSPLDDTTARRRALEESALFFSGMIYGWSFDYDIGEQARGTTEEIDLQPVSSIPFGDAGLSVTDVRVREMRLYMWADYRLDANQSRRLQRWKTGTIRSVQATGHAQLTGTPEQTWLDIKKAALDDAARTGIRAILRANERNRPKQARGFISLAAFPRYWIDSGQWSVSARFRLEITEIIPFAAY